MVQFLLDANVLCRIAQPDDPQHAVAKGAVRALISNNERLNITPQVV